MSLLRELYETVSAGAISAGAFANSRGPLFAYKKGKKKGKNKMLKRQIAFPGLFSGYKPVTSDSNDAFHHFYANVNEDIGVKVTHKINAADVISKLKSAEEKSHKNKNSKGFALEDEDGKIVKVYVSHEEAEDFEEALASMLGDSDDDEDGDNSANEIAEVLFKLKDRFDILDVEWGEIQADEEEEEEASPEDDTETEEDPDAALGDEEDVAGEEDDVSPEDATGDEGALNQLIDIMKADAEAKLAQAEAQKAAAEAEKAKAAADAASHKVRQEEQILDMEAEEAAEKEAAAEAKKLAKLARYQHKKAQGAETDEVEDMFTGESVSIEDASKIILENLKKKEL
jgi:hypothetical protein